MFGTPSRARIVRVLTALALVLTPAAAPGASAEARTATVRFPPGFLWGVSTSGFQSEGHFPDSNWTRNSDRKADPYGNAVDFRHRYPSDLKLAKGLGVNVFRTSIEWARIEPRRGRRDPKALAYYDALVRRIRANGMRPMLTLDHWVHPGWVVDQGGWSSPRTRDDWLRNARFVVNRYKGQGVIWITFNEATIPIFKISASTAARMPTTK